MKRLTTIFLALLLFGCDSQGNDDPNVSGVWSGVTGIGNVVTMNLVEKDNGVTGSGKIGVVVITILGTHNFPNISLTSSSTGFSDSNYTGIVSSDGRMITGNWSDTGFPSSTLVLRK